MRRSLSIALGLAGMVALAGCSNMSQSEQRMLSGTGIGAAGGAVVGAIAGNTAAGALIGAGAGLAGGYLYDQHKKSEDRAYQQGVSAGKAQANRRPPAQPQSNPQ